jgi:RNA polymerase sigma-70 factor (ECF subfamily)
MTPTSTPKPPPGQREEFLAVYAGEARYVAGLVRKLVGDGHELQEIVQDVWLNAWKAWGTCTGAATRKPWLLEIARNKVRDFWRKRLVRDPHEAPAAAGDDEPELQEPVASRRDQAGAFEASAVFTSIEKRVDLDDVELLFQYYVAEMTADEMAAAAGVSMRTMQSRIGRAKERLRRAIDDDRNEGPPPPAGRGPETTQTGDSQ